MAILGPCSWKDGWFDMTKFLRAAYPSEVLLLYMFLSCDPFGNTFCIAVAISRLHLSNAGAKVDGRSYRTQSVSFPHVKPVSLFADGRKQ